MTAGGDDGDDEQDKQTMVVAVRRVAVPSDRRPKVASKDNGFKNPSESFRQTVDDGDDEQDKQTMVVAVRRVAVPSDRRPKVASKDNGFKNPSESFRQTVLGRLTVKGGMQVTWQAPNNPARRPGEWLAPNLVLPKFVGCCWAVENRTSALLSCELESNGLYRNLPTRRRQ
jgi:hypothetical protein